MFNVSFFSITGQGIDLDYCDIECVCNLHLPVRTEKPTGSQGMGEGMRMDSSHTGEF